MGSGNFLRLLEREFVWPSPDSQQIKVSEDWTENASLAQHPFSQLVLIAGGYRRGADVLVEQALSRRSDMDSLVYPILFCYRHFLNYGDKLR